MAYVYIVKCCDETYYTGMTQDLRLRIKAHKIGKGAMWTRKRLPVELVYSVATANPSALEKEIKNLSREEKEVLIKSWNGYPNERIQCGACSKDLTNDTAITSMTYPVSNKLDTCYHHYFCNINCLKQFVQIV